MSATPAPLPVCNICNNDYNIVNAKCDIERGEVTMVALNRADFNNMAGAKVMTPVSRPARIQGKVCSAIIGHIGENINAGHWVTFLLEGNTWVRVDSALRGAVVEDPFMTQRGGTIGGGSGLTLDIFFFI